MGRAFKIAILAIAGLFCVAAATHHAAALSFDEARAACVAKVRPGVIMCMARRAIAQGGPLRAYAADCREPVVPIVRACVLKTMAAGGHPVRVGAICPLGFDGCFSRCIRIGGFGMSPPAGCSRVCGRRCSPPREFSALTPSPTTADQDAAMATASAADHVAE